MSDTDVYRLIRRYSDEWHVMYSSVGCTSGLYSTLKGVKGVRTRREQEDRRYDHSNEYKIQKLGVRTHSKFVNGLEVIYRAELHWVDVDA